MFDTVLTVVYLLIGLYCIYTGFVKKGIFYNNERVMEGRKEAFDLLMSRMMLVCGLLLSVGAVLELLKFSPWISIGCYSAVIIALVVFVPKIRKNLIKVR